jgi:hypothetical protein
MILKLEVIIRNQLLEVNPSSRELNAQLVVIQMPLHQEWTRFDIKSCISRKKAGRSIKTLDDNYYSWSFEMTM